MCTYSDTEDNHLSSHPPQAIQEQNLEWHSAYREYVSLMEAVAQCSEF